LLGNRVGRATADARERWLTRSEAARLLWAAWRARQVMRDNATMRAVGRHVARFILVGLYTGTRSAAICGAALMPTVGRGHVDLERGVFYRRAIGRRKTKKGQPPVKLPPRLLAHMRRWAARGLSRTAVVEWNGKPVASVRKGFEAAVRAADLGADVTPHYPAPHLRDVADAGRRRSVACRWLSGHDGAAARSRLRTPSSGLPGTGRGSVRGTVWGQKPREQNETNGCERDKNRLYFKGVIAIHLVRDEGVAGSNPATPTNT
jgi:hypothetical protein